MPHIVCCFKELPDDTAQTQNVWLKVQGSLQTHLLPYFGGGGAC